MPDELVKRGYLTQSLGNALHSGEHGLQNVPGLLKHALENHAWEKRIIVETGEEFEGFHTFTEYVKASPPKGLGASPDLLRRIIGSEQPFRDMLEEALQQARGNPTGNNQYTRGNVFDKHISSGEEDKTTEVKRNYSGRWLNALRKKDPELHKQVIQNKISLHEAAIQANIYPTYIRVNMKDPKSAAAALIIKSSPEFLSELRRLLCD